MQISSKGCARAGVHGRREIPRRVPNISVHINSAYTLGPVNNYTPNTIATSFNHRDAQ